MIVYEGNSNIYTRKQVELINAFSNVTVYEVNIQNSTVFLYLNNEEMEIGIEKYHLCLQIEIWNI